MTNSEKEAAYYRDGMLKQKPSSVPSRVRVMKEVFGDPPFFGAGVAPGGIRA